MRPPNRNVIVSFSLRRIDQGFKADKIHGKMGVRASDTANIYFNNVRVPKENLVGIEGNGFIQLMKFFDHSRVAVAAHGVGLAQGALEQAINYVKKRKQFGQAIGSFQVDSVQDCRNGHPRRNGPVPRSKGLPGISTGETPIPNSLPWQSGGPAMLP